MKSLLLFLTTLFLTTVVHGQDLTDFVRQEMIIWNPESFDNQREILRQEARAVWTQMKMPMSCRPAAYKISEALYGYQEHLRQHRDDRAREALSTVFSVLKTQDACFDQVATFYGFWSVGDGLIDIGFTLPFFIELFNRGKLLPVRELAETGHEQILGAYQCQTSTIYFDPFRGPNDLKNILTHELAHFIRDKFLFSSDILRGAPRLTAIEYSIVDETLAVLAGTLTELDEDRNRRRDFDLSLFRDNGTLVESILAANRAEGEGGFLIRPSFTLREYMQRVALQPKYEPYLENLIKLVASVYAPHTQYRSDVLVAWLKHYDYTGERFWTGNQVKFWSFAANTKYKTIDNLLNSPSATCKQFHEQIRKGELRDYLGTKSPNFLPQQPGTEGTKPTLRGQGLGSSSVRLCRPPPAGL